MKLLRDFHSHTTYSDGKGSIEDNVKAAISQGLQTIAITDHGFGHAFYGMKKSDLKEMRKTVDELRIKYPQIQILLGVEANILSRDGSLDASKEEYPELDILIAGYHFGSKPKYFFKDLLMHAVNLMHKHFGLFEKRAIRINTQMLCEAMRKNDIFILTHPGDKGPIDTLEVAKVAKEQGVILEVNERHHHLTVEQLKEIKHLKNLLVVSSDAHYPQKVARVERCFDRLQAAGIDIKQVINVGGNDEN